MENLVKGVVDDVILQKIRRHFKLDKKACKVSPFLQLRDPLQQPVEDRVDHRLAAGYQTLSEAAPARHKEEKWLKHLLIQTLQCVAMCCFSLINTNMTRQHKATGCLNLAPIPPETIAWRNLFSLTQRIRKTSHYTCVNN